MNFKLEEQIGNELLWHRFLKDNDEQSFSDLYNRYSDELYSYGIHLGFKEESCKDAIQDVFYRLYLNRGRLMPVKNFTAYLFKSYKHRLVDIARRDNKSVNINPNEATFTINLTILDDIISEEESKKLKIKLEEYLVSP